MNILNKIIWSSKNSEKISLTLKGLSGLILTISVLFNIGITPSDWETFSQALVGSLSASGIIISSIITMWGLIRKFI